MEIGNKVRFLDAQGGGIVRRINGNMAYIEDEDGFEIPTLISQCVVVSDDDDARAAGHAPVHQAPISERAKQIVEAKTENERLLAKIQELKAKIAALEAENEQLKLVVLNNKFSSPQSTKSKKSSSERPELKAIDGTILPGVLKNGIIEVDLHINTLLETTDGMDKVAILKYQMDVYRKTMETYRKCKAQKIIFIHGKGEGVLRKSILDDIRLHYPLCTTQDASFQQYGFGATMVTIH